MKWVDTISEWWALVVGFGTAVAGVIRWRVQRRSSQAMLLKEYEELKKQIILFIKQEVKHAEKEADNERFKIKMRSICPGCYEKAMKELEDEHEVES